MDSEHKIRSAGEAASEGAQHESYESPLSPYLNKAAPLDYAHLAGEAVTEGVKVSGSSLGEMADEASKGIGELWEGEAGAAGNTVAGLGALAAPLTIGSGVTDMVEGVEQYREGDHEDGVLSLLQGGAKTGSGAATIGASFLGSGAMGVAGPALGSFAGGVELGRFGDSEAKRMGVFHDQRGANEGISDWASDNGVATDEWMQQHTGSKAVGQVSGAVATGVSSIAGTVLDMGSAALGATERLWNRL